MSALENELEFLTVNAIQWQEWSSRDYELLHTWRDCPDALEEFIQASREHAFDSARARLNLFKLIDLRSVELREQKDVGNLHWEYVKDFSRQ